MITLPTRTDLARYSFKVSLDAVNYTFEMEWNDRAGAWFITLLDGQGDILVSSVRVVVGFPLLSKYVSLSGMPQGLLEAVDTSETETDPGYADLGERVELTYTPLDEL